MHIPKFGQILSVYSQDIEYKGNYDRRNDGQPKSSITPLYQSRAIQLFHVLMYNLGVRKS